LTRLVYRMAGGGGQTKERLGRIHRYIASWFDRSHTPARHIREALGELEVAGYESESPHSDTPPYSPPASQGGNSPLARMRDRLGLSSRQVAAILELKIRTVEDNCSARFSGQAYAQALELERRVCRSVEAKTADDVENLREAAYERERGDPGDRVRMALLDM